MTDERTHKLLDSLTKDDMIKDELLKLYFEHLRRQAIATVRFCDMQLYGRNDHTIPERQR